MALVAHATEKSEVLVEVIQKYFEGVEDARTLESMGWGRVFPRSKASLAAIVDLATDFYGHRFAVSCRRFELVFLNCDDGGFVETSTKRLLYVDLLRFAVGVHKEGHFGDSRERAFGSVGRKLGIDGVDETGSGDGFGVWFRRGVGGGEDVRVVKLRLRLRPSACAAGGLGNLRLGGLRGGGGGAGCDNERSSEST